MVVTTPAPSLLLVISTVGVGGDYGALGDNNTTYHNVGTPFRVLQGGASAVSTDNNGTNLINVKSVSSGSNHTCAVTTSGNLYCWGQGDYGALGDNNTTPHNVATPFRVLQGGASAVSTDNNGTNCVSVSGGNYHTCAVTTSGNLCWGLGDRGQLGDDDVTEHSIGVPYQSLVGEKPNT